MKLLFIVFFLIGCGVKVIPLKGSYEQKPFQVIVDKPKDLVWDNIIDFFATKGLTIRIIDRSSGLITSDKSALTWTYENNKGGLVNPSAWVVVAKMIDPNTNKPILNPTVYGDWNIRIKEADGKTLLNVNLVNINAYGIYYGFMQNTPTPFQLKDAKSTGNFEKMISDIVK